jgi:DNA modification methylase
LTIRILQGDVREQLAKLPSDSFDCIVTSPPYWGLRDYGTAKWEGGDCQCDHAISRGDSAAKSTLGGAKTNCGNALSGFKTNCGKCGARRIDNQIGLEPTLTEYLDTMVAVCRELLRVLKPSGTFWLNVGDCYTPVNRGENARPRRETMTGIQVGNPHADITTRKEVIQSLRGIFKSKDLMMIPNRLAIRLQEDGWYVRSEIIWHKPNPMPESVTDRPTSSHEKIWLLTKAERYWYDAEAVRKNFADERNGNPGSYQRTSSAAKGANHSRQDLGFLNNGAGWDRGAELGGRNARNVWTIASQPYSEGHFATFPPELAERCIKAGCPAGGHVLDPFGGAGTTGLVADRLGREATLIELNPSYVSLIKNRIVDDAGMFAQVAAE